MSGLEVAAAVASIVSAFTGSVALYRSWRKQKTLRLLNAQNGNLERSLVSGETSIQQEYASNLSRLGPRFAIGDDRARAELSHYVIKLQHVIITLMTESTRRGTIVLPSLPIMLSTSDETRMGVISALGQQYQRLMQSAPISATSIFAPYGAEPASRALAMTPYSGYVIGSAEEAEGDGEVNEPAAAVQTIPRYNGCSSEHASNARAITIYSAYSCEPASNSQARTPANDDDDGNRPISRARVTSRDGGYGYYA